MILEVEFEVMIEVKVEIFISLNSTILLLSIQKYEKELINYFDYYNSYCTNGSGIYDRGRSF